VIRRRCRIVLYRIKARRRRRAGRPSPGLLATSGRHRPCTAGRNSGGHSQLKPPAGALRLRDEPVPSRQPSTQAKPSRPAPGCPGRSSGRALHLDTLGLARPLDGGSTADGIAGTKALGRGPLFAQE